MLISTCMVGAEEDDVTTVPGIDVSYWQAEVNWPAVRGTGQHFVFIKATEGLSYTDPTFSDNWRGAASAGLLRGAYCLFHPSQDARKQAQVFLQALKDMKDVGELPCSIDLEVVDGVANQAIIAGARTWINEVEQALGRRPLIYSGVSFLETNFTGSDGKPPTWVSDYALWLGWFPSHYKPGMSPLMPTGWSSWSFWQFGGTGRVNGIRTNVDQDVFNGSLEALREFAGLGVARPAPRTHTVAAGETLQSIADAASVPLGDLVEANPQLLQIGDKLNMPPGSGSVVAPRLYTVQAGDTLRSIAARFGCSVDVLIAKNKILEPDIIQIGQTLIVA